MTVSDTGNGISPEDLSKIFGPFYTKKVMGRSGTGLGLPMVWGTVKDHHGHIDVQSEEGKGSRFILYFPVTREEPEKIVETASPVFYRASETDRARKAQEMGAGVFVRKPYILEKIRLAVRQELDRIS